MARTVEQAHRGLMELRRFASLSSALSITIVAATGIAGFLSAPHGWIVATHTVLGFELVLAVTLHVMHNARPLALAARSKRRRAPSGPLLLAALVVVGLGGLAYTGAPPIRRVLAWGKARRERGEPKKTVYSTITLDAHGDGPMLSIDLKAGPWFRFIEPEHGWDITPQIAIWTEDLDGHYLETLYVTHDEAKSDYFPGPDGRVIRRPEALPVWGHARGVRAGDGIFSPSRETPLPDTVTAASPRESAYVVTPARTRQARFVLLVEVNNSCDYNDYYARDAFPNDLVYSGDGFPAQPSVVYRGIVDTAAKSRFVVLELVGHGEMSGRDGRIDPDLSHMTTGLQILDRVVVEVSQAPSAS